MGAARVSGHRFEIGWRAPQHVHYEVWYDDKVRNPDGFLRVGMPAAANSSCMVIACSAQRR